MYSMRITLPITLFEKNATFLDPNIYVVTLYEIVTRGVISTKVESGFARFARSTTITLTSVTSEAVGGHST